MNYRITQEQALEILKPLGFTPDPIKGAVFVPSNGRGSLGVEILQTAINNALDKVLGEQWQPIDTVPVNESVLMLRMGMYGRCGMSDGYKQENGVVVWAYIKDPTHWMPLPSAPKELK